MVEEPIGESSDMALRLWTCTDHEIFYPVGGASVVVAETEAEARELLFQALDDKGLRGKLPFVLHEIKLDKSFAYILQDGNY